MFSQLKFVGTSQPDSAPAGTLPPPTSSAAESGDNVGTGIGTGTDNAPADWAEELFGSTKGHVGRERRMMDLKSRRTRDNEADKLKSLARLEYDKSSHMGRAAPTSINVLPESIKVGDGGAAWRKRARIRQRELAENPSSEPLAPLPTRQQRSAAERAAATGSNTRPPVQHTATSAAGPIVYSDAVGAMPFNNPLTQHARGKNSSMYRQDTGGYRQDTNRSRGGGWRKQGPSAGGDVPNRRPVFKNDNRTGGMIDTGNSNYLGDAGCASDGSREAVVAGSKNCVVGGGAGDSVGAVGGVGGSAVGGAAVSTGGMGVESYDCNNMAAAALRAMLSNGPVEQHGKLMNIAPLNGTLVESTGDNILKDQTKYARGVTVLERIDSTGRDREFLEKQGLSQNGVGPVQTSLLGSKGKQQHLTASNLKEGFYGDDGRDLDSLYREAKTQSGTDYDYNYMKRVMKSSKYSEDRVNDDFDEVHTLSQFEDKQQSLASAQRSHKQRQHQIKDKTQLNKELKSCLFCVDSDKFSRVRGAMVIAHSAYAYVCFQSLNQCAVAEHIFIAPVMHVPSLTHLDDDAYDHIRNFQKSLIAYFDSKGMALICVETVLRHVAMERTLLGGGGHCVVECYPVHHTRLQEAKSYFTKALREVESEWSQHKKIIDTSAYKGPRGAIPKQFPYFHVDFNLSGGMGHIIENEQKFPKNFAKDVVKGMLSRERHERPYASPEALKTAVKALKTDFEKFDWSRSSEAS